MNKPFDINTHEELSVKAYKWVEHKLLVRGQSRDLTANEAINRVSWIAAIFYIKWVEFQDGEQEAIADFNGDTYESLIPKTIFRVTRYNDVTGYLAALKMHIENIQNPRAINLKRVFSAFTIGEQSRTAEEIAVRILNCYDFSDPHQLHTASSLLESIVYTAFSKMQAAGYYTPKSIVDLMVELANPQVGEQIYDPCFGAGGLLVESAKRIHAASKTLAGGQWEQLRSSSIYGVEWNETAYVIALSRIVLAGIPEPGLELNNALTRPHGDSTFDVVLACPPWGRMDSETRESLRVNYNIPANDWSNLFVQHSMRTLKPGGRAVIAVPDAILYGGGPDRKLREWLLRDFKVDGIISLPEGAFSPYTGIKASLVLFSRLKPSDSIYFYQVQKLEGTLSKTIVTEETITDISRNVQERKIGSNSWTASTNDLSRRNWELVAKKTGDDELGKWINKLCTLETKVQLCTLQQVADVYSGCHYDRALASDKKNSDQDICLARIADIHENKLELPRLYINSSHLSNTTLLKSNDILISKTGTIGKIALISSDVISSPIVATQNFVVIRPNSQILPNFLFSILKSGLYQNWLNGHARGASIQNLPVEVLKHMPVPVPELIAQEVITRDYNINDNIDPTLLINEFYFGGNNFPSFEKMSKGFKKIAEIYDSEDTPLLKRIEGGALLFWSLMGAENKLSEKNDGFKLFPAEIINHLHTLLNIAKVPDGVASYALLSQAQAAIDTLLYCYIVNNEVANSDMFGRTFNLLPQFNGLLISAISELKSKTQIILYASDDLVVTDLGSEITVSLHNSGCLPLFNIEVLDKDSAELFKSSYIVENGKESFSVPLHPNTGVGKHDFSFQWTAKHIDNESLNGSLDLAIVVKSIRDLSNNADIGSSPYVTGSPIEANRPEMFFGRQDIIESIKRQLPTSQRANIILLEGNRRSGKTSILNQLSRPEMLRGWIPVYCNFQGGTGDATRAGLPTYEIFKLLTKSIFDAVVKNGQRTWFPDLEMPDKNGLLFKAEFAKVANKIYCDENAFDKFELYLQSVLRIIAPNRILLMLDEFDKVQEGIDTGITSPQVPENFRYILHTYPETSAILSYSKILRKLRNEYWSMLFGLGHRVTVAALEEDAAKLLVTRPAEGKLIYSDQARDKIITLCGNQPFIIQQLCNCIFDKAADSNQRSISENIVDAAAQHLSSESEHFRTLWDHHIGSERRRFILALCEQLINGPDSITFGLLETKFRDAGIYARNISQALKDDIDHLRALDLISMHNKGRYSLTIPLMASWIQQNIDFEGQKRLAQNESQENL